MPDLTITLNYNEYTIPPQGYVLSGMVDDFGYGCVIAITPISDSQGMYILGDTFLRNFITSFDYKKNTISFAVNPKAPQGTFAAHHMNSTSIVFIVIGVVAAFALGIGAYCFFNKRKMQASSSQVAYGTSQVQKTENQANNAYGVDQTPLTQNGPNQV